MPPKTIRGKVAAVAGPVKVRATHTGFFRDIQRRPGDVFTRPDGSFFSRAWIERVSDDPQERSAKDDEEPKS